MSVTFASAFIFWLARETTCYLGGLKFFWITFTQELLTPSWNSRLFTIGSPKCSLPPVLANELANFRSLAKVKQKRCGRQTSYELFCAHSRRLAESLIWMGVIRSVVVHASLSMFNTVIIT